MNTGLDQILGSPPTWLSGTRFALLANQASLTSTDSYAWLALAARFPSQLVALFAPQHGLWGEQQANMIESPHETHRDLGIPIYSLYSETRCPSPEMLDGVDVLLVDLQDVGTRVYTFASTMIHCMEVCASLGVRVVVLDRPNPLGGDIVEGPVLDMKYSSFVGRLPIPMRHGMTMGELALMARDRVAPDVDLEVVPCERLWRRAMPWTRDLRSWIAPSPNLPDLHSTLLYPGLVLLEGTNLSEGRGTTLPFQMIGAPYVDGGRLAVELDSALGVRFLPVRFRPTFDKWAGQLCHGVRFLVKQESAVSSYRLGVRVLSTVARLWPDEFEWIPPPYEYENTQVPIDIISGSAALRQAIDRHRGVSVGADLDEPPVGWKSVPAKYKIYD